jgi:hypothetical protein
VSTTLDGQALFDEQGLEIQIGPWERTCVERAIPGLDGVLSIDLGRRSRKIRQRGTLHAIGGVEMTFRIDAIEAFSDGGTHTLVTAYGRSCANVRLDAFRELDCDVTGAGVALAYEITYTQLGDQA